MGIGVGVGMGVCMHVCKCECVGMVCGDTCVMAHTRKAEDAAVNSVLPPVSKSRGEPGSPTQWQQRVAAGAGVLSDVHPAGC